MNERIKELAIKAGLLTGWTVGEVEYQKFALLIVQKCADIADTAEPFLSSDLIKQHFGVEE
jgi:hypothetical protein